MRRIKIAQIGIGHNHASAKMLACRKFPEIFDVVGFAESDENWIKERGSEKAYQGLKRFSEQEILAMEDLDAVLVESDVWNLNSVAERCIERGLHVHIDKPAGEDLEQFARLLSCAKEKGLVVQMAYMYRNNTAIKKSIEIIEKGIIGDIVSIDTMMSTDHSPEYRKWLEHFRGGSMYIFGCHLLDIVYRLMGKPLKTEPFLLKTGFDGNNSYDNCFAVLEYQNGISTVRTSSVEVNGYGRRQIVICGTKGTIEIKPLESPTKMYLSVREEGKNIYCDSRTEIDAGDNGGYTRYDEMMTDFAAFVRGEKSNPYDYSYELELQKLVLSCCNIKFDEGIKVL